MREAIVAIVGEPNVGKSTLLNKILEQRIALTSNVAGTTRDRFYAPAFWNDVDFTLVDTAGIIFEQREELEKNIQKQVEIALQEADLILYVLDGKKSPETLDRNILLKLRKKKKDIILVINKIDAPKKIKETVDQYHFTGFKNIVALSSVAGIGVGDLLDEITKNLAAKGFAKIEKDPSEISVSLIGKPNVGKSSIFNKIIGEERVVVSATPGTTRNVIDTDIVYKTKKIKFLDTAGLKKKEKKQALPDVYASFQTIRAMHKSDVCILVIDSSLGITQQDQRIAGEIVAASKGLIIVANKSDLLTPKEQTKLEKNLPDFFEFLWWAPAVQVSAKSGQGISEILDFIVKIEETRHKNIDDETMREFFHAKLKQREPQRLRDERIPKVYSLQQVSTNPPVFLMMVNEPSAISMQFRKFIQNAIIKELQFWGTPVKLKLEAKRGNPKFNEDHT
ncbi:MAG: GTPase Der [Candidatus Doudnabacteria bacterium]|nr:GTPase Der [Candidatus Doudnabacteria bacterium]